MAELQGFVFIHRKMLNWGWYTDMNTKAVFLHLLLTASFKDTEWHGIKIHRGDVITSINSLSQELNLTPKQIRVALSHLEKSGETATKAAAKCRIITVKNYDFYQSEGRQGASKGQAEGNQGAGKGQHRNNVNNVNNGENVNKADAPTEDEVRDYCAQRGYSFSAERFFKFYSAANWQRGSTPITNWRALADYWQLTEKDKNPEDPERKSSFELGELEELAAFDD